MNRISAGANSFSLRLVALIIVPLLGLTILAAQRIENDRRDARTARELVEEARLDQAVAAIYVPAQLEQIALEGLATVDSFGVERELVVSFTGVDFSLYDANEAVLDSALDAVDERFGDVLLSDGRPLDVRLDQFRAALDDQRELSDLRLARQPEIRRVFADLDVTLRDAVAVAGLSGGAGDSFAGNRDLSAVATLMRTAGDRGRALLEGLIDQSPERTEQTLVADARVDVAVEQLRSALPAVKTARLDALLTQLAPLPESVTTVRGDSIAENFDVGYIEDSASAVINQLDFLESLERYSAELHDDAVTELEADARRADEATDRTQILVLATILVSGVLLFAIAWSILTPLRRLTRRAELIGSGDFDADPLPLHGPTDVRTLTSTMNEMADTLSGVDREISRLSDGGSVDATTQLPGAIGESIDRSFRRLSTMTSRLHASETLASAIVAQAADAIWTIDPNGTILSANDASATLLGIESDAQVGTPLDAHLNRLDGETTLRHASGETAHVVVSHSEIDSLGVTAVMAHDISDRRRFQERLAYQAHHDALTQLPNRLAVLEALDNAEPERSLAVLFVDLDGFKSVNDMQGHLVGDRVLTEVGRRLRKHVRTEDVVGRLGGDEFVVVMGDVESDAEATDFAARLVTALEEPYRDGSAVFTLSASVGVATFLFGLEADGLTALDAIRRADGAVYAAKARGRGNVELFDFELESRLTRNAEIEHSLRAAIADDELELHLQPVLDLTTNTFTSAEALVRWNRPGVGMVPPGEFIPIAEKSSLIEDVGRWVLRETCRTLVQWKVDRPMAATRIAVNIAGSHLLEGDLVADVDAALLATGADPTMLSVELTESQLMDDVVRAKEVLVQLRDRGIRIAIDDFGTGYSSMAYLRELPIDTLKIDRSFVAPIENNASDTTVIDAMLTVGHALGMSIIAEGIETDVQLAHLTSKGCDQAQGFLMARPMPIPAAAPLIGSRFADLVGS